MLRIQPYSSEQQGRWDRFVTGSKNGVFLFFRNYMDYHSDRFDDFSMLFLEKDELVAILPAHRSGRDFISHGGLTFGGVVSDERMTVGLMLRIFEGLIAYLKQEGFGRVIYKPVARIYHKYPSDEDLYALFIHGGRLMRRDLSTTIALGRPLAYAKGRKWSLNRARKAGLTVTPSLDFESFMGIEQHVLRKYHGTKPAHSAAEIKLLAGRFPENIRLFGAFQDGRMLAGVIVYADEHVAHTQYIAATDEGREIGASDLVLDHLIRDVYVDRTYFDFGISTEQNGYHLNSGLALYKENFGGRAIAYDWYELMISV